MLSGVRDAAEGLGNAAKTVLAAGLVAGTAAVVGLAVGLAACVKAAAAEETGISRLGAAVKATGADWGTASAAIEQYLAAEGRRVALDDGAGRESLSQLTTITGDYHKALALLPLALDVAAAKGMDLVTASELVGRVAQGNTTILSRYGIVLEKGATATEALAAMQERFAGAAEAVGNTYEGASRKVEIATGNLAETIGTALLPTLTGMNTALADFATQLLPVVEGAVSAIGPAISQAAGMVWQALGEIGTALGMTLGGAAATAAQGGRAIGESVARGIESALPYIIGTIKAIGQIIAYFFKPGSPPEIAKDIDDWGQALVKEYFKAFQTADFSPIQGFSRQLESVLEGAIGAELLTEEGALKLMEPLQNAFAGLFGEFKQFGQVGESAFANLSRVAGPVGAQIERLARSFLKVEETPAEKEAKKAAERAVEEAAAEVERATEAQLQFHLATASATDKLQLLRAELNKTTSGSAEYWRLLAQVRAGEEVLAKTIDQAAASAERAAEAQLRYRLATASSVEKVVLLKAELAKLAYGTAEYWTLLTQVAAAEQAVAREIASGAGGVAGVGAVGGAKGADEAKQAAEAQLRYRLATATAAEKVAILKEELAKAKPGSAEYWALMTEIATAEEAVAKGAAAAASQVADLSDLMAGLEPLPKDLGFPEFKLDVAGIQAQADKIASDIFGVFKPAMDKAGGDLGKLLAEGLRLGLSTALFAEDTRYEYTQGPAGRWIETIVPADKTWAEIGERLKTKIGIAITGALTGLGIDPTLAALMGDNWEKILVGSLILKQPIISTALGTLVGTILVKGMKGAIALLGTSMVGLTAATLIPVLFPKETMGFVTGIYLWMDSHIAQPIKDWLEDRGSFDPGKTFVDNFLAGLDANWQRTKDWFATAFTGLFKSIKDFLGIASPSTFFMPIGEGIMEGIEAGAIGYVTRLKASFFEALASLYAFVKVDILGIASPSSLFQPVGQGIMEGIESGITGYLEMLKGSFKGILNSLYSYIKVDILGIASPSTMFWGLGQGMMEGLGEGAAAWLPTLLGNLEGAFAATDWARLGVRVVDGIIDAIRGSASRLFGAIMDALLGGAPPTDGGDGDEDDGGGGGGGGSGADGGKPPPTKPPKTGGGWSGKVPPRYQGGIAFAPGGMAIVGEAGPELVYLPRGASVQPITNNYYINANYAHQGERSLRSDIRFLQLVGAI